MEERQVGERDEALDREQQSTASRIQSYQDLNRAAQGTPTGKSPTLPATARSSVRPKSVPPNLPGLAASSPAYLKAGQGWGMCFRRQGVGHLQESAGGRREVELG